MKPPIPLDALKRHTAILGMTGSGKSSTGRLMVEEVVAQGHRVCVLDTIKSDWWGITSSASGKKPGLPFKILGGPRGHLPLHSSAGKAIGQLVGAGKLPLSIIDVADFEPGGLQRFFVDFVPSLMRAMKGVVYLVIEEAHEVAPKERAGFGAENMAIHYAKKLGTGGRTKGIRLIVATQRVQALHNAVLGSCETVIAHRIGFADDQVPVLKWVRAKIGKQNAQVVEEELANLPDGVGFLCSGAPAKIFERVKFPLFKTYDNTKTPEGGDGEADIKTAPVDQEQLRAIIGDAAKEAEANDPKALRAELAKAKGEIAALELKAAQAVAAAPAKPDKDALAAAERKGFDQARKKLENAAKRAAIKAARETLTTIGVELTKSANAIGEALKKFSAEDALLAVEFTPPAAAPVSRAVHAAPVAVLRRDAVPAGDGAISRVQQKILDACAEMEVICRNPPPRTLVAIMCGYDNVKSARFAKALSGLSAQGFVSYPTSGTVALTGGGRALAAAVEHPGTSKEVQDRVIAVLGPTAGKILSTLIERYPGSVQRAEVAANAGYDNVKSAGFAKALSRLSALGFVDYPSPGEAVATEILFPMGAAA